jgi:DNA-binding cell septation regulator SpoVG
MMLRDLSLHENDKGRWIKMPSRAWTDNNGDTQYTPIIQFTDSETRDSFRDAVLAALDRHLAERARRQKQ